MTCKFSDFFSLSFGFVCCCFLAVHFAHMKTPTSVREIASHETYVAKPWYDASFKY